MPVRRRDPKARHRDLSASQDMELRAGPHHLNPSFADDTERAEAWRLNRDGILAVTPPGHRPWAWWQYDARRPCPPWSDETAVLAAMGELRPDEPAPAGSPARSKGSTHDR